MNILLSAQECDGPGTVWDEVQPFLIAAPCIIGAAWAVLGLWVCPAPLSHSSLML